MRILHYVYTIMIALIHPHTKKDQFNQKKVYENVNIPDKMITFQQYPYANEFGCKVTRYWDEPGL